MDTLREASSRIVQVLHSLPGSEVVRRYVRASHQNDPARTLLELLLFVFVLRTWAQSRTRGDSRDRSFIQLDESEVDELVHEWVPEPLVKTSGPGKSRNLDPLVIVGAPGIEPLVRNRAGTERKLVNLASPNFSGFLGNESIKHSSIQTLKNFGVGSCGPPGFYGTFDVHMDLERDLASFLGVEAAIIYSQSFITASSVIPSFSKRGDLIIADKGCNFSLQKGILVSRSTVKWYNHQDLDDLERILEQIARDDRRHRRTLTRRFIVTEGLFENDGSITDLQRLISLKNKFKYRLILDESWSFGILGKTGRGLSEYYNVPVTEIDIMTGSMNNAFCTGGGFCAGPRTMVTHQRINSPAFVYSAALAPLLATSSSLALSYYIDSSASRSSLNRSHPLENLDANIAIFNNALANISSIQIPSAGDSPLIHIFIRNPQSVISARTANGSTDVVYSHNNNNNYTTEKQSYLTDIENEELILQEIVDQCFDKGLFVTRTLRIWNKELFINEPASRSTTLSSTTPTSSPIVTLPSSAPPSSVIPTTPLKSPSVSAFPNFCARPSIRVCVSAAMPKEQVEKSASIFSDCIRHALGQ